ncbi:lysozyme [Aurantiacibacter sp. MUD61]|uniref:lysozyme n=1 Tax=Aurantiacibacter sp. MUD61 TaxID=3009083 RepID=UPI0022F0BB00|nr:lysozyme [Aurantiacibacter sp. MUD61]
MSKLARWMRGEMVRELVRRMRRKSKSLDNRRGKRKTALALSAGIMALSPGAVEYGRQAPTHTVAEAAIDAMKYRVDADQLSVSEAMKEALAEEEGVMLTVYRDVAGYPTVGVGHLVRPADNLKVGDTITYEQAIAFLEKDIRHAEEAVKRLVGDLPLYQYEFDALVDLVYNVGEGNVSEDKSPKLNVAIKAGDYQGIADELRYHTAAGSKANGLIYRSERRQAIFTDAAYGDPRPIEISVSGEVSA